MIPSTINEVSIPSPRAAATISPKIPNPSSIQSWKGAATVNVIWNIRYMITKNIGNPKILLVTILSILSVRVFFSVAGLVKTSLSNPSMYAYLAFAITSSLLSL